MAKRRTKFELARPYNAPAPDRGVRVIVDQLWPHREEGRTRAGRLVKELAPSTALRHRFNPDSERCEEFHRRFFEELEAKPIQLAEMRRLADQKSLLLIYGARDGKHNNAVVLKESLEKH